MNYAAVYTGGALAGTAGYPPDSDGSEEVCLSEGRTLLPYVAMNGSLASRGNGAPQLKHNWSSGR